MDLRLLGPVEAEVDGRPVTLGTPKQRAVLAMLALDSGRAVSVDRLVDGLWGDDPPPSAPKMVQIYVSQLRRLMDGNGAEIIRHGRGYELRLTDGEVDVVRFRRLLDSNHSREALDLWRGGALSDLADEPFAAVEIGRLEELRLRAVEQVVDADLAAGRHAEVIPELETLVAAYPLRERLHAQRMLALYRAGRQSEALAAYREARAVLVEEVGVEPGAELQQLQLAILDHDPKLDLAQVDERGPEPEPEAESVRSQGARGIALIAVVAVAVAGLAVFAIARLTGEDNLAQIDENAVGLIDPNSGQITSQYVLGGGPGALAAGGGSVWAANGRDGTVARLVHGRQQVATIDVGGEPTGIAFGAGSLWVADGQGRTVAQVDPYAGKVVQRFDIGNVAQAVAVGYGAVWATSAVDGTVARIDLARGVVTDRIAVSGRPTAIAAGAGGVWVASEVEASVVRIDPRSRTAVARIPTGNAPASIAIGAGAVWVTNRVDGNVSRIDPATDRVTDTIRTGREPRAVVADANAVWVANGGDGTVVELAPQTPSVIRRVNVRNSPGALALADGLVWSTALPARETHRGGRLRVVFTDGDGKTHAFDPSTLDPFASLAYDGLVSYRRVGGSAGGVLVPNLARDLPEPSADGLTYVFRLRPGIRFSNGQRVTPAAVRRSIERLLAMVGEGGGADYLPIRGARRCTRRRCDLSDSVTTDAVAGTVTVQLTKPDPEFLHKFANVLIVPVASPLGPVRRPLPGTGPYMVKRWDSKTGLLVRNPHFHVLSPDRPDGLPDAITLRGAPLEDQISAVERGASDVAVFDLNLNPKIGPARSRFGARLHTDDLPSTSFLFMNTRVPPFDDARVRRALNYAVDRAHIAGVFGSETNTPTCQLLPPGFQGSTPVCSFTLGPGPGGAWTAPDLTTAERLVAASGTRGMRVEFWVMHPWDELGSYFRTLLGRLGYRSKVRVYDDLGSLVGNAEKRPRSAHVGLAGWIADSAGPSNFVTPLISCAGTFNLSHFCDPDLDAKVQKAAQASGPAAVVEWRRAEAALAAESPTVPLVNQNWVALTAERVGNYQSHTFLGPLLDQMWVK